MNLSPEHYKKIDRIHLLRLKGNAVERAQQHGKILKGLNLSSMDELAIHTLAHKNQTVIERALQSKLLTPIYEALISKIFLPQVPKDLKAVINEVIHSSGANPKESWLALYQPDMLMVLAALSTEKYRGLFLEAAPGCSSALLNKTKEHEAYFSRNLDYPAASVWEKFPAVFYHEPDQGQRFFHAASLGIHTAGLTGANESGIAFSLHAHFSKKISFKGFPIFFAGDQLMEKAKTLNEAIDILRKFKAIGNWAFNLSSFAENKSISVELAEGRVFLRETDSNGTLAHSNGFQHRELLANQLHFTGSVTEDLFCRKSSIETYMRQHPHYTLQDSMKVLANHRDLKTGKERIFGNTVSVVTTIQSVIFEPHTQSVYVSTRAESPTDLGPYLKLPFFWENLTDTHLHQTPIEVEHGLSEGFLKALHHYHLAYTTWHVAHENEQATLPHLQDCAKLVPNDPHVWIQKGYFELKTGLYEDAKQSFFHAIQFEMSPNMVQAATYFLGASLDLCGAREEALVHYQKLLNGQVTAEPLDPKLKRKSIKRLKKAWRAKDCQKIQPDLQFVEPIDYP